MSKKVEVRESSSASYPCFGVQTMDLVLFVLGLTFETSLKKKYIYISSPKEIFKEYVKFPPIFVRTLVVLKHMLRASINPHYVVS